MRCVNNRRGLCQKRSPEGFLTIIDYSSQNYLGCVCGMCVKLWIRLWCMLFNPSSDTFTQMFAPPCNVLSFPAANLWAHALHFLYYSVLQLSGRKKKPEGALDWFNRRSKLNDRWKIQWGSTGTPASFSKDTWRTAIRAKGETCWLTDRHPPL